MTTGARRKLWVLWVRHWSSQPSGVGRERERWSAIWSSAMAAAYWRRAAPRRTKKRQGWVRPWLGAWLAASSRSWMVARSGSSGSQAGALRRVRMVRRTGFETGEESAGGAAGLEAVRVTE